MNIDATRFQQLLGQFKLPQLFNELGWDQPTLRQQTINVNGVVFTLTPIAHKRGVAVLRCSPDTSGKIPPRPVLLKIEHEARKLAHEHLLVFADAGETMLTWLWVLRAPGKPASTRTHTWHKGQSGEALRQKLSQIVWSLEEEEAITLTDVITGLRRAFDRDKVSKSFYDKFKAQHDAFAAFITGLNQTADRAWYASLMLNRLMFVYFLQKKGFLDADENYLQNRMKQVQQAAGKGQFHSFYRQFLRRLFHEGLGQPQPRDAGLTQLIGANIPYLNGGLFDVHELEAANHDIDVPDEAFEKLFAFFDAWDWHLDDRPLRSGKEINPDVLGYIFEKYINQKQMGAYYTKEDITEYISKNTVIPHLLEQARERCKVAFEGESSVWKLLQAEPDRYIYPAMKIGVIDANGQPVPESALPDFVQTGMKDAKARMFDRRYNLGEASFTTATGERGTLPTETWREYVDRRSRCLAVREQLANGQVQSADDLITLNLDIRQFMQDVIDTATSPDLLRAVWQTIVGRVPEKSNEKFRHGITILDPTCGSGAFLFAALNILEPLYEACLDRMEGFVEDAQKLGKPGEADFVKVLVEVGKHPSRRYYVYKNIILHNLFGVDIMAEAVEICKLRLFLKLVSQVDKGQQLEPLPDIDFNIRAGNTLVGYATEAQFDASGDLASDQQHKDSIKADIADLADLFSRFREQQTVQGGKVTAQDKRTLRDKLRGLSLELDRYLARDYGIDPDTQRAFDVWRESHQPFHWFAEFYGVMREDGFDVVIGNPPYLEAREVGYNPIGFASRDSNSIHAMCIERSCVILSRTGAISMIVPLALTSTQRMKAVQSIIENGRSAWYSNFAWRPAKLFDTVNRALTVFVGIQSARLGTLSTKYIKWTSDDRQGLFERLTYANASRDRNAFWVPKIGHDIEQGILKKLLKADSKARSFYGASSGRVFYRTTGGLYWKVFTDSAPEFFADGVRGNSSRETSFSTREANQAKPFVAILSSNLFWWWYTITSNLRDLNPSDIQEFSLPNVAVASDEIVRLADDFIADMQKNSTMLIRNQRNTGQSTQTQSFKVRTSKPIIDKIDLELGRLLGFTDEETDFIINYDIKYRMGGTDDEA